jgi:hypothetical protein
VVLLTLATLWSGCAAKRVEVVPALTPVDASRPYFIAAAVKGTACGDDATARALDDLFRVSGADGFVAAVIERDPHGDRCVTITARPLTYGCTPRALSPDATGRPMHVVPGPTSCAASEDTCLADCGAFAAKLQGGEFETSAFKNRCLTRCRGADTAFLTCARAAQTAADVRRCDGLSP